VKSRLSQEEDSTGICNRLAGTSLQEEPQTEVPEPDRERVELGSGPPEANASNTEFLQFCSLVKTFETSWLYLTSE